MNNKGRALETIKTEAEQRVAEGLVRLSLQQPKCISEMDNDELEAWAIKIGKMDAFLRKQEILNYPQLVETDFFDSLRRASGKAVSVKRILKEIKEPGNKTLAEIMAERKAKRLREKYLTILPFVWFGASIILGSVLYLFMQPPDFILSIYAAYAPYIEKYELFCVSMMAVIFLMPWFCLALWRNYFKNFVLPELPPVSIGSAVGGTVCLVVFVMAMVCLMLEMAVAYFMGLGGGSKGDPRKLAVLLLDWTGGVLTNIICFTAVIFFTMMGIKIIMTDLIYLRRT